MGLFSKIKKAFKKVVKGVKKVVKKIGSSKILKALAIAAAVVVTGGAAIGAFGNTLATSGFGSWMVGASNAITGFKIGSLPVGAIMKPFASVGKAVGSTVGAVTDLTGITTKAGRMGYTNMGTAANPNFVVDAEKTFTEGQSMFGGSNTFDTAGRTLADVKGSTDTMFGIGKAVDAAGKVYSIPSGKIMVNGVVQNMNAEQLKAAGFDPATFSVGETGEIIETATGKAVNVSSSEYLTGNKWGDFALRTGTGVAASVATGYAQSQLMDGEGGGVMTGLSNESKEYQDRLQLYASESGFDISEIYKQPAYGTADPVYQINSELYRQQTVGVPA